MKQSPAKTKATLSTSDLMKAAGVGRNTIRFYEKAGLIAKPNRTAAGYRLFPREALADIEFIQQAKHAGFTLGEIKELLQLGRGDQSTCGRISQQIEKKLADIATAIADLQRQKEFLTAFAG